MDRLELAARIREVRSDLYGEHGAPLLADDLGIPAQTWTHYESGVTVPGTIVLALIAMTRVNPGWLLHGDGEKYGKRANPASRAPGHEGKVPLCQSSIGSRIQGGPAQFRRRGGKKKHPNGQRRAERG